MAGPDADTKGVDGARERRETSSTAQTIIQNPDAADVAPAPVFAGPQASEPLPFQQLGPYKVVKLLGRGGMGAVYEGFDENLQRRIALKVLSSEHAQDRDYVRRFITEAQAVARINHPNVVQIFSAGTDNKFNFFAMEFVEGRSLEEIVDQDGPLTPFIAVQYLLQTVRGLHAAYEQGIIHRDVKPANLMLANGEQIKVTDFGLAKAVAEVSGMTQTGAVIGTPFFLSPEQGQGSAVDHRTDIYSLGASLYYLLTGKVPYTADNAVGVILQHVQAPVPQIPRAPPSLNRFLAKMMAKKREDRHPDYGKLLSELVVLERGGTIQDKLLPTLAKSDREEKESEEDIISSLDQVMKPGAGVDRTATTRRRKQDELSSSDKKLLDSLDKILNPDE